MEYNTTVARCPSRYVSKYTWKQKILPLDNDDHDVSSISEIYIGRSLCVGVFSRYYNHRRSRVAGSSCLDWHTRIAVVIEIELDCKNSGSRRVSSPGSTPINIPRKHMLISTNTTIQYFSTIFLPISHLSLIFSFAQTTNESQRCRHQRKKEVSSTHHFLDHNLIIGSLHIDFNKTTTKPSSLHRQFIRAP